LATLYSVSTKRLNEQVKRNSERFPNDFMFQLTGKEKAEVVANCDHLLKLKFSPMLPYAFAELGALMARVAYRGLPAYALTLQIMNSSVAEEFSSDSRVPYRARTTQR
jgi:hypothetical protein